MTDTYVHSSGTATLVHTAPILEETQYQLIYTITGRTAGTITITFGEATTGPISDSGLIILTTALSVSRFTVSPTADFDGTCTFSLRVITNYSDACQWDNLIGCYEDCGGEEIYSPGLWVLQEPQACQGSLLAAATGSEYYVESEFAQESGTYVFWIDSDTDLSGIVQDITDSVVSGSGYINEYSYAAEPGYLSEIGFLSLDEYRDEPFVFTVSAIQLENGPKRTFEPINCFVLGASQCI